MPKVMEVGRTTTEDQCGASPTHELTRIELLLWTRFSAEPAVGLPI